MDIDVKSESKIEKRMNGSKDVKIHIRFDDDMRAFVSCGIGVSFKEHNCLNVSMKIKDAKEFNQKLSEVIVKIEKEKNE